MPLLPCPFQSREAANAGIKFRMLTRKGVRVRCLVERTALEKLLSVTLGQQGLVVVFDECRELIESVASQKYDCSLVERGLIVIRPEDIVKAGLVSLDLKRVDPIHRRA